MCNKKFDQRRLVQNLSIDQSVDDMADINYSDPVYKDMGSLLTCMSDTCV